ncbi:class I SAM-dependent methyltransferase [Winogradskyella aurantiaca]|uniref:hypothetical protein n=1 Tax=Winogradskyella aurantiaca TaxID=2219558 RepID=UPI001300A7CE|nr:hypothetical protein [Winogradskyella aurantiaca]
MTYIPIDNRLEFFTDLCKNKTVIHFGCTDWPVFNPDNNLHIQLSKHTKAIDGFDIDLDGLNNLKKYVSGNYFSDFSQLKDKSYDVCLVPETIEHVDNVRLFLEGLSKVRAEKFLITAPNAFSNEQKQRFYKRKNQFVELIHPDHNYWFSPYTLKNCIKKYMEKDVKQIYLLQKGNMVCCEF